MMIFFDVFTMITMHNYRKMKKRKLIYLDAPNSSDQKSVPMFNKQLQK